MFIDVREFNRDPRGDKNIVPLKLIEFQEAFLNNDSPIEGLGNNSPIEGLGNNSPIEGLGEPNEPCRLFSEESLRCRSSIWLTVFFRPRLFLEMSKESLKKNM